MRLYFNSAELNVARKLFQLLIDSYIAHCAKFPNSTVIASSEDRISFRPDEVYCAISLLNRMEQCASLQKGDKTYLRFALIFDENNTLRGYRYRKQDVKQLLEEKIATYLSSVDRTEVD